MYSLVIPKQDLLADLFGPPPESKWFCFYPRSPWSPIPRAPCIFSIFPRNTRTDTCILKMTLRENRCAFSLSQKLQLFQTNGEGSRWLPNGGGKPWRAAVTVWVPMEEEGSPVVPTKSPLSWVTARWAPIDAGKGWLGGAAGMLTSTEDILSQIWNQQTLTRQQMWKRSQLKSQGSSFCLLPRERKCSRKKEAWLFCDSRWRAQGHCTRRKLLLPVLCRTRNRGLKRVRVYWTPTHPAPKTGSALGQHQWSPLSVYQHFGSSWSRASPPQNKKSNLQTFGKLSLKEGFKECASDVY